MSGVLRGLVKTCLVLGLAVAGASGVATPAEAGSVAADPACSVQIWPGQAIGGCASPEELHEHRVIVVCRIEFGGADFDQVIVSDWKPTNEIIRVPCRYPGWIVDAFSEVRPKASLSS